MLCSQSCNFFAFSIVIHFVQFFFVFTYAAWASLSSLKFIENMRKTIRIQSNNKLNLKKNRSLQWRHKIDNALRLTLWTECTSKAVAHVKNVFNMWKILSTWKEKKNEKRCKKKHFLLLLVYTILQNVQHVSLLFSYLT